MERDGAGGALEGLEAYLGGDMAGIRADLEAFAGLLARWQKVQNLVSRETLDQIWTRHMRDSLQLLAHMPPRPGGVLDLGSGGGFPALPLAIALKNTGWEFHLVEANRRKCAFLRTVARELALKVSVHDSRIEALDPQSTGNVDIIVSRATAPLVRLLGLCLPFWSRQTRALLHKGREYGEELNEAGAVWRFDVVCLPSVTDPAGAILRIDQLSARPSGPDI